MLAKEINILFIVPSTKSTANVDFGHRTPMTILPIGDMAEINCSNATLSILESGVE